LKSANFTTWQN